jgi:sugar/nucleoside kinase (ribokinase family)
MSVDVTVVGNPFLDLVFEGLPRIPGPGQEVVGTSFHAVPGGTAIQAIGMARLGLSVALVSSRGTDAGGRLIADVLEQEGVRWIGPQTADTPTTAILSVPEGTAMATAPGGGEPSTDEVSATRPSRVVLSLGRAGLRPPGVPACFVTGSIEVEGGTRLPEAGPVVDGDVMVMNAREAATLTGETDVEASVRTLAQRGGSAVVTDGGAGAVGVHRDELVQVPAPEVHAVDATGAGDLFVAALLWATGRGLPLRPSLEWACLSAGLSVTTPTALAGALHLDSLLDEGRRRGLTPP